MNLNSLEDDYSSYQPDTTTPSSQTPNGYNTDDINNVSYSSQVTAMSKDASKRWNINQMNQMNETIQLPQDSANDHSNRIPTSVMPGGELEDIESGDTSGEDEEFLFNLRERLLKMASFGGLNKICVAYLRNLQRAHQQLRGSSNLSTGLSETDDIESEGHGRVCKEGSWLVILFAAVIFTFTIPHVFSSESVSSYSAVAQVVVPTIGLTFLLSVSALFSLLFATKQSLMFSCPLATLSLFVFGLVNYVVNRNDTVLVLILITAVIIGFWGARSIKHITATLPLFEMSVNIIRHHVILLPIAVLTTYLVGLWSFHIITVIIAITNSDLYETSNYSQSGAIWILVIFIVWIWSWFVQVCRYVFQSVVYGIVSYHYHLSSVSLQQLHLDEQEQQQQQEQSQNDTQQNQQASNSASVTGNGNNNTNNNNNNRSMISFGRSGITIGRQNPNQNQNTIEIPTSFYYNDNINTPIHIPPPPNLSLALLLRILTHSLGSIAHGALFAAQARIFWLLVRKVAKIYKARHVRSTNRNRGCFVKSLRQVLLFSEWLHCRFNKFAFRYIMIYGYGFKYASRFTYKKFMEKGTDTLTSDLTAEGFVTLYAVTAGAIAGIVSSLFIPDTIITNVNIAVSIAIAICVAVAVGVVLDVMTTSIICVFSCYGEWAGGLAKYDTTVALSLARAVEFAAFEDRREMEEAEVEARG